MATVFDGDNLLITLDTPVLGVLTLDVQRLYSEWKEWQVASFQNMGYPPAFRPDGGADLTPGVSQGSYYFLRNDLGWRIQSTDADQTVYVIGNLTPSDSTLPLTISTPGRTVIYQGLQPITQNVSELLVAQQDAAYRGRVYIDEGSGSTGTTFPTGLVQQPVNNITDALVILARVGGKEIWFRNQLTLDQDLEGFSIFGQESSQTDNLSIAGYSLDRSVIEGCLIDGAQGGTVTGFEAVRCGFGAVTSMAVSADRCAFFDDVSLKSGSTNIWLDCKSGVPANLKPVISCSGALELQVRGWIGGFDATNIDNASFNASFDFMAGRLAIRSSCTAGNVVLGGTFSKDAMDQAGTNVLDRGAARMIAEEPLEGTESLEGMMRLVRAAAAGNVVQQPDGSYVIKSADGGTNRIEGDLATNNGRTISLVNSS